MIEDPLDSPRDRIRAQVIPSPERVHLKRGAVGVALLLALLEGQSNASGVTHSFVSLDCVKSLGLYVTELSCNVVVTTLRLEVILGMDWQAANHVLLDCREKTLIYSASMLEILRLLSQGVWENTVNAMAFMVMFSMEAKSVVELEYIPVVRDFLEVFPENVLELPPKREIKFAIDLISRVSPISMAPYRMSSVELAEVKK
ncbi:uncharacterized protein LOC113869258 [Abrus precatorius]|uniref:Uncharacterized protein LOC113869258 n=1 Tax=Abrus precatorius TaxID=3816 RepID=A0A8B8LY51_ABRPR|nr:uncharacterized protein LOC113869258 [Abrus precatorius]